MCPPKKGHHCLLLSVSLCFSLAFYWTSLCRSLFLCLSLVIFFLPSFFSFFFDFLCFLVFAPLFLCLLLFHEKNNIKILNYKVCFINPFCFLVSCLVLSFKSLFLIIVFLISSCAFVQHQCFSFQKAKFFTKETVFGQEGVATNVL